jgi:hypothetical protein
MIHLREPKVLVREVAQLGQSGVDIRSPVGDGGQQLAQAVLFDDCASDSVVCDSAYHRPS